MYKSIFNKAFLVFTAVIGLNSCSKYTTYTPVLATKDGTFDYYNRKIGLYDDAELDVYLEGITKSWDVEKRDENKQVIIDSIIGTKDRNENLCIKFYAKSERNIVINEFFCNIKTLKAGHAITLKKGNIVIESNIPKTRISITDTVFNVNQYVFTSVSPFLLIESDESSQLRGVDTFLVHFKLDAYFGRKHIEIERQDTLYKRVLKNEYYHNIHK